MRHRFIAILLCLIGWMASPALPAHAFDHAAWNRLLIAHVHWNDAGTATAVDYAGFSGDRKPLDSYLKTLAAVPESEFRRWGQDERQAFLINAYNAATVQLILTRYPNLTSIKDLGNLLSSPWRRAFVPLLGRTRSLDDIEHGLLRGAPDYGDPRIHFAVNCASIGCPALRPEAYVAARLDAQLADQTRRFLRDRSRNRIAPGDVIEISPLFDWYEDDFDSMGGVGRFLARHGDALGATPKQQLALREGQLRIRYLDYDWRLNKTMEHGT